MINIRDRDAIVARLRDAQRRFERGGPVPIASGQLIRDLADALAESGPLEMHVPASSWLSAVRTAERGVASIQGDQSRKTVQGAKRSLRELELFFSGKDSWWDNLTGWGAVAVVVLIPVVVVLVSHDKLRAVLWTAGVIAALAVVGVLLERYEPDVKEASTWLDLPDRQLFAHSVKASTSEIKSFARAKLGAYVRPVLIATDRRLVLARPVNEVPGQSDSNEFELAWQIPYTEIRSFSSKSTGGESPDEIVTVESPERQVTYKMEPADGNALVAVLKIRAPDAYSESAAPPLTNNKAPAAGDTVGSDAQPVNTPAARSRPPKWLWLSVLPIGLGAWVPLLAGIRAHNREWQWTGSMCCLAGLAGWALLPITHGKHTLGGIAGLLLLGSWIVGCVTTWQIRGAYAERTYKHADERASATG